MTSTRPDLSWSVTKLSQHLANPDNSDWNLIKQTLQYIKGTLDYKLTFQKSDSGLKLTGFSNADWGSSLDDRKSISGYNFLLNESGPSISWRSKRQQTVALSTCEAEYMALSMATQEALFLRMLLRDFNTKCDEPTEIFGDNQGSIALIKNPNNHSRSKHIDIKYHFIRDNYNNKKINIKYISSEENIADIMTKPTTKHSLERFKKLLLLFG